ncbi:hypothetical protein QA646_08245 [Rhizobium sp. CB3090]|uniref:hypothetical protein n=1 Tax=Rhizobium sp. CB3090 TaxID=3039156 RepID=UPI0024B1506D|nr:hypothetical protein [Rhizobium sp. CB3090]WFU10818.1 hypothetical protein QA646_08245 [Rhizobium sp. CB3090]
MMCFKDREATTAVAWFRAAKAMGRDNEPDDDEERKTIRIWDDRMNEVAANLAPTIRYA